MPTWDKVTDQRILLLHPLIRQDVESIINEVETIHGFRLRVTQGLRTFAQQDAIYNQPHDGIDNDGDGKIDEPDEKVSNAKAGQSFHNYGLAWDCVEILKGQCNWKTQYNKVASIAAKYGFAWGGNFSSFKDLPHFQKPFGYTTTQLLKLPRDVNGYPIINS